MINNDVLKRIRYILALNEAKLKEIFTAADSPVSSEQLEAWLEKDGAVNYKKIEDSELATFLNGLINYKRGKKEGAQPAPEKRINNNIILKKLKIALDIKNEELMEILSSSDSVLSPHELTALFRKKAHRHYRTCKDTVLINILNGLKVKYRDDVETVISDESE